MSRQAARPCLREPGKDGRSEAIFLAGAVLLAGALRLAAVGLRGTYVDFDEGMYILLGRNLFSGLGYTLNELPNATFPFGVPVVAGLGYALTGSARWALNLPTAIFGALTILPVYLLMRETWSRTAGASAAILFAGLPALLFLVPYVPYGRRLYSGSEAIFLFFILSGAYASIAALRKPTVALGLAAGFFSGMAFEVRQEALAYFVLLCGLVYGAAVLRDRRVFSAQGLKCAAAAAVVFALLAAPFFLWVYSVTGRLYSGPRFATTYLMRDSLSLVLTHDRWGEALSDYFSPNADNTQLETPYYGVAPYHRARIAEGAETVDSVRMLRELRDRNLRPAWRALKELLPPGWWIFAAVCLVAAARERRWGFLAVMAALVLPSVWITLTLYPLGRFYLVAAVAVALVGVVGFDMVLRRALEIGARAGFFRGGRAAAAAYLAVPLVLALWMGSDTLSHARGLRHDRSQFERALEDKVDYILPHYRRLIPADSKVVAWGPMLAARSDTRWLALPEAPPERIIAYTRNRGADFLVARNADGYWIGYTCDDVIAAAAGAAVLFDEKIAGERYIILDMKY